MDELADVRRRIDALDRDLAVLLERRLRLADAVAAAKRRADLPVSDPAREAEVLDKIAAQTSPEFAPLVREIYAAVFAASKARQRFLL